jgi:hypothetical protein
MKVTLVTIPAATRVSQEAAGAVREGTEAAQRN